MATMSIRVSDSDKNAADNLFKELGTTTNSAINMFLKQCIRLQKFPFTPSLNVPNEKLVRAIEESDVILQELRDGKRKGYTDSESLFEALDNEI